MCRRASTTHLWTLAPWQSPVVATRKWLQHLILRSLKSSRSFSRPLVRVKMGASRQFPRPQFKIFQTRLSKIDLSSKTRSLTAPSWTHVEVTEGNHGLFTFPKTYLDRSHLSSEWSVDAIDHSLESPGIPLLEKSTLPSERSRSSPRAPLITSFFTRNHQIRSWPVHFWVFF